MRFLLASIALAGLVFASPLEPRDGGDYHGDNQTLTTYTTVTTCPVTKTYTEEGTTTCVTEWTTSTITVTDCKDCAPATTVPGPTVTHGTTTEVEVTYETTCPTTETIYGPTKTYVTTHTVTSKVVTKVPTTVYESVPGKDVTHIETDVEYSTYTSICPVTEVTTIAGEEKTITYTTTKLIETKIPKTVYETEKGEDSTVTETDVEYSTYTSVCPVTEVITKEGKEITTTYTTTKLVETKIEKTVYETEKGEDSIVTETDVEYSTYTSVCPVTEVTTIAGEEKTITYTTTKLIETKIPKTIYKTEKGEDSTITETELAYSSLTSEYPVTSVKTIEGEEVTLTYTKTKVIETQIPKTVIKTISKPGKVVSEVDVHYTTKEATYAVTQTEVVSGSPVTKTYQTTSTTVEEVPTTTATSVASEESAAPTTAAANPFKAPPAAFMAAMGGVLALF